MRRGNIVNRTLLAGSAAMMIGFAGHSAHAGTLLVEGVGGQIGEATMSLSASAEFMVVGNELMVTLTNTASATGGTDWVPSDLLTGVYFNTPGLDIDFSKVSAIVPDFVARDGAGPVSTMTNTILNPDEADSDDDGPGMQDGVTGLNSVGGEWGYLKNAPLEHDALSDQVYGIAASGYIGGGNTRFDEMDDLDNPESPNGPNYGIAPLNAIDGGGNDGLDGSPLIRGVTKFTLGNVPAGFDPMEDIADVVFTYGTSGSQPSFTDGGSTDTGTTDMGTTDMGTTDMGTTDSGGGEDPFGVPEPVTGLMGLMALATLGTTVGGRRRR